jgi:hypothetical protein
MLVPRRALRKLRGHDRDCEVPFSVRSMHPTLEELGFH